MLRKLSPDVIIAHNLHDAGWWPDLISACARHAATIWVLHDMWSFTGRCAYSGDCRKFVSGCDDTCPTPTEYPVLAPRLIAGAWKSRGRLFMGHPDLVAVCPSRWLAGEAKAGLWKGHRVEVIPYGVPLDVYKPLDRAVARAALGIDTPGPVLVMSAQYIGDRRKGPSMLVEALQRVTHRPLTVVTMGRGSLPIKAPGVYIHSLGYVDHERTRVLAYNAADMCVHPATADNLPNSVMEAIACGTPAIGFPVGGVLELVRPGQTGWLAGTVSGEALAEAIDRAFQDLFAGIDLRLTCRAVGESEYSSELQVDRYLELIRSLGVSRSAH
jgi:glycosyltransferase involved in cell wall biosynthesis